MNIDKQIADLVYKALTREDFWAEEMRKAGVTADFVANYVEENFFEELLFNFITYASEVGQFHCPSCGRYLNADEMAWVPISTTRHDVQRDGECRECYLKNHPERGAGVCSNTSIVA